jgi:hypothetical protein
MAQRSLSNRTVAPNTSQPLRTPSFVLVIEKRTLKAASALTVSEVIATSASVGSNGRLRPRPMSGSDRDSPAEHGAQYRS